MATTVQVREKTLQLLSQLKKEMGLKSYDELINRLIAQKGIPTSMFGSNKKLKPFTDRDEAEFHEL